MGTAPFFFPAKSSFSVTTLVLVPVYFSTVIYILFNQLLSSRVKNYLLALLKLLSVIDILINRNRF